MAEQEDTEQTILKEDAPVIVEHKLRYVACIEEKQETCEHKWKKAYRMLSGTVVEMCELCRLRKDEREMTDEEAEKAYRDF